MRAGEMREKGINNNTPERLKTILEKLFNAIRLLEPE